MKATLLLIGLVLWMSGIARQNQTQVDSTEIKSYNFSGVEDYSKTDNIFLAFKTSEFTIISSKFDTGKSFLGQTNFSDTKQQDKYNAFLNAGFFGTSKGNVPFWMRSMKYGNVPTDGISFSLIGGVFKEYNTEIKRLVDWGAGFEGRINAGTHSEFILIESYAKLRFSIFELKAGRYHEQIGLVDSTLSTGSFSLSGNALGVPKIEAGIANYWNVPLTRGAIAIKGNIAHGWMDKQILRKSNETTIPVHENNAYYHQLSAYGRIGKQDWNIRLYGGLNHLVIWGLENELYSNWGLSEYETFLYIIVGKPYGKNNIPTSMVGNHVGTIDQAMEWETGQILFTGYHQFFYDVEAIAKLANVKDGLWGISLKNKHTKSNNFHWNKILFEFMYSKSQGGEIDSNPRTSGAEDYYNNFEYYNGWSYKGENLGNTLFTSKKYLRKGYPTLLRQYFPNNRIIAYHGGTEFEINNWFCKGLLTYTLNYGTYTTSTGERGMGSTIHNYNPPYFPKVNQYSAYFESNRELRNGFELGIQLAFDKGDLLYNSVGCGISLTKRW